MIRVMIVDDEPAARDRYAQFVAEYGRGFVVCAVCSDGGSALRELKQHQPHVIITDIKMPGDSGLDLMNKARAGGWDGCGVVISGFDDFSFAREALRLGMFDYLLKPVFPDDMARLLDRIAEKGTGDDLVVYERLLAGASVQSLPPFLRKALAFVHDHLESEFTLTDVADWACVSANYLSSAFTKYCRMHFIDFVHRCRIEKAKTLLASCEDTVGDIARRVGYSDVSYFFRVFKKATGCTPGEYRAAPR